jgi:hypothetical protein
MSDLSWILWGFLGFIFVFLILLGLEVGLAFLGPQKYAGCFLSLPPLSFMQYKATIPERMAVDLGPVDLYKNNTAIFKGDFSMITDEIQSKFKILRAPGKAEDTDVLFWQLPWRGVKTVADDAETISKLMLQATSGPWTKDIPDDLQGVFWMDGNAISEELAVMNMAQWNSANNSAIRPISPAGWSWLDIAGQNIVKATNPEGREKMQLFWFETSALTTGRIWTMLDNLLSSVRPTAKIGRWSMERLPGPGVNFYRGCYWVNLVEFGSYKLRKIMHTDGTKIQPAFDDYVHYRKTKQAGKGTVLFKGYEKRGATASAASVPVATSDLEKNLQSPVLCHK